MKLSRPALASAAALVIAASSLPLVHSTPADEPLAVTPLDDGTQHPAPEPDSQAAADFGAEAEKPAAKEDAAEGGTELDPDAGLPGPGAGAEDVGPEVEAGAEITPDHANQPSDLAKMTKLTEAPKKVSGGGKDDQWWFKTTKQKRNEKELGQGRETERRGLERLLRVDEARYPCGHHPGPRRER